MSNKWAVKWWWAWNPGKIEIFLENMALKGWKLIYVGFTQTIFKFRPDKSKKIRYCMDYNNKPDDEYMNIIKDDGWELVDNKVGWIMWRKEYAGDRPHIFTDNQSLINRNTRLLRFLSVLAAIQVPVLAMTIIDGDFSDHQLLRMVISCLYIPLLILLVYGITRLFIANRKLKSEGRR